MLHIPSGSGEPQHLSEARLQVKYAMPCLGWLADYVLCACVGYWQLARKVSYVVKELTLTTSLKTDSAYICIFEIILFFFLHIFNLLI